MKSRYVKVILILSTMFTASSLRADETQAATADSLNINALAEPFFKKHCIRCHGASEAKGELRLDAVDGELTRPTTFE